MTPHILHIGPFGHPTGYAHATHAHLMALYKHAVLPGAAKLSILVLHPEGVKLAKRFEPLKRYVVDHIPRDVTHAIIHMPLHKLGPVIDELVFKLPPECKRILMTAWESDGIPDAWAELLKPFDQIWVPSEWNEVALSDGEAAGNTIRPIHTVPHPFDPEWFCLEREEQTIPNEMRPYKFYSIGTWDYRKNPLGVLQAYFCAFTKDDKVSLTMVVPKTANLIEVEVLKRTLGLPYDKLPPVEFLTGLSDEKLRDLHYSHDCYVTMSRSEGYGLGAFEACAAGNHVIAPQFGGFLEFLTEYPNRTWIGGMETPVLAPVSDVKVEGDRVSVKMPEMGGMNASQLWFEPSVWEMIGAMRGARLDARFAIEVPEDFHDRFSYAVIASDMMDLLGGA